MADTIIVLVVCGTIIGISLGFALYCQHWAGKEVDTE